MYEAFNAPPSLKAITKMPYDILAYPHGPKEFLEIKRLQIHALHISHREGSLLCMIYA